MKLRISGILSLVAVTLVTAMSIFSLVSARIIKLDAAASPVFSLANSYKPEYSTTSFNDAQNALAAKGITLSTSPSVNRTGVTFTIPDTTDKDVLAGSLTLQQEWLKYTPEFIKASGLKKIYLVKDLSVNTQSRSAMAEPILEDALYFDVSPKYLLSEKGEYIKRTFHHEYWHLIDYNLFGKYQGNSIDWVNCNVSTTQYGSSGGAMYNDPQYAHTPHPATGFINGYATSAIEEDRAEIFATFMTNPESLQRLASVDAAINCKTSELQTIIKSL